MSKRDLPAEKAAELPRVLYTPAEVSAMTTIEYQGVLAAIKDSEIPAVQIGVRYYVPAWWVNKHLTGAGEPDGDELAERRAS
jgi:hypothetical protein